MLRSVIAVVVGIVVASLGVFAAEYAGHRLYPTPDVPGYECAKPETYRVEEAAHACIAATPVGAKVAVVAGWFFGAFLGSLAALAIGRKWAPLAWIVALVIFLLSVMNFFAFPHPWWMMAGAPLAALLAAVGAITVMGGSYRRPAKG